MAQNRCRKDIVGKRFLCYSAVSSIHHNGHSSKAAQLRTASSPTPSSDPSRWPWRSGTIRAATHHNTDQHDLQVNLSIPFQFYYYCTTHPALSSRPLPVCKKKNHKSRRVCICIASGICVCLVYSPGHRPRRKSLCISLSPIPFLVNFHEYVTSLPMLEKQHNPVRKFRTGLQMNDLFGFLLFFFSSSMGLDGFQHTSKTME